MKNFICNKNNARMWTRISYLFFMLSAFSVQIQAQKATLPIGGSNQPKCIADEISNSYVQQQLTIDPGYQNAMDKQQQTLQKWTQNYIQNKNIMTIK